MPKYFYKLSIVSSSFTADVNFASELSDLRHRHGFRVILIHGNQTSSALLQHAHCHVPFQEITADLPPCMLVKSQVGFHQYVITFGQNEFLGVCGFFLFFLI